MRTGQRRAFRPSVWLQKTVSQGAEKILLAFPFPIYYIIYITENRTRISRTDMYIPRPKEQGKGRDQDAAEGSGYAFEPY